MYVEVGTQLELSVVNLLGFFLTKFGTETLALGPVLLLNRYYIIFVSQLLEKSIFIQIYKTLRSGTESLRL